MTKHASNKAFLQEKSAYVLTCLRQQCLLWDRYASGNLPQWQMKACRAYIHDIITEDADKDFMDCLRVEDESDRLLSAYAFYAEMGDVHCVAYYYRSSAHGPSLPRAFHPYITPETNTCPHLRPPTRCSEERCQLRFKPAYFNLSYTSRQLRKWIGEDVVLEVYHPADGWMRVKDVKKLLMTRQTNIVIFRVKEQGRRNESNANLIGLQELVRQMEIVGGFPHREVRPDPAPVDVDLALKPYGMTAEEYAAYLQ